MRLHRIFVDPSALGEGMVTIVGSEAHHVAKVLRLGVGDELLATDGQGNECLLSIVRIGQHTIVCRILSSREPEAAETRNPIVLMQCCLSSNKMDFVIQKTTEMGAAGFMPVISEKSKFRGDGASFSKKVERWQKIAEAAALQSGRAVFPPVQAILPLTQALKTPSASDAKLLLTCGPESEPAHEALPRLLDGLQEGERVFVLIGPESGLSEVELRASIAAGFAPVRMGKRTLRADTAPIVALALVLNQLGEL